MILTIDVGIKNLSMCCMSCVDKTDLTTYQIHLWDTWNTLDMEDYRCVSLQKNGKTCGKLCNFTYVDKSGCKIFCCKTHFPKDINLTDKNRYKKKRIDQYLLQDIARIVLDKLSEIWHANIEILKCVDHVLIELQPKINTKMKFISHILYGKFVELYYDQKTTIRFVRASQKLKAYTGPKIECCLKGAYAKRKWLSIQYTNWFLQNKISDEEKTKWLHRFIMHTKKDDISDTYLMAINALFGLPKSQLRTKGGKCIK